MGLALLKVYKESKEKKNYVPNANISVFRSLRSTEAEVSQPFLKIFQTLQAIWSLSQLFNSAAVAGKRHK